MTTPGPHVLVWEFRVPAAQRTEFERRYGPAGDWAQLFARGDGYLGTQLLHDTLDPDRYLTLDRWRSAADWEAFRAAHAADYAALDAVCEALTTDERALGAHAEFAAEPPREP
jgi:heme-degrading monooxygenase HmoA